LRLILTATIRTTIFKTFTISSQDYV
jgi:hypothetical protein